MAILHPSNKPLLIISFLLLVLTISNSCKKELPQENFLLQARDWYMKSTTRSKISISSNKDAKTVNRSINWNSSRLITLNDGNTAVVTPVSINLNNSILKGSFMLVITKLNGDYKSKMIYNSQNDYFNENTKEEDIKAAFDRTLKNDLSIKQNTLSVSKSGAIIMDAPIEQNCTDWYLVETDYDEEGQIIYQEITFLYLICTTNQPGGNTGGNAGVNEPADTLNRIQNFCIKSAVSMAFGGGLKNDFRTIMDSTILGDDELKLTIEDVNLQDTTFAGNFIPFRRTLVGSKYFLVGKIQLNTQVLPNASKEFMIVTIYHEIIHSYLDKMGGFMFTNYNHQYMATTFVNKLQGSLQGLFPTISPSDANALAWLGLQGTPMWDLRTNDQKNAILNTISKYRNGILGTKCINEE